MKIFNYTLNKYITFEEIQVGTQLRVEGKIRDVENFLSKFEYEEVAEGHETDEIKRVYIVIKETEFNRVEQISKKDFDKAIWKFISSGEIEGLKVNTSLWHYENDIIGSEIYITNENYDTVMEIAYISNLNNRIEGIADTSENLQRLLKDTKKMRAKYSKWFKNFDIKVNDIEEMTV